MMRVEVKPELLRWARERAGLKLGELAQRIPQLPSWERGETRPTLKQRDRRALEAGPSEEALHSRWSPGGRHRRNPG